MLLNVDMDGIVFASPRNKIINRQEVFKPVLDRGPVQTTHSYEDRRRRPRVFMDLPGEIRETDAGEIHGGIIVDGSELGFLIHSIKDMSIGRRLNLLILFNKGSDFSKLEVLTQIVRKKKRVGEGQAGYEYGLKIVEIGKQDFRDLTYLLQGSPKK